MHLLKTPDLYGFQLQFTVFLSPVCVLVLSLKFLHSTPICEGKAKQNNPQQNKMKAK